jgi:hypothetical protein
MMNRIESECQTDNERGQQVVIKLFLVVLDLDGHELVA